ncbi:MAG: hypothetical protein ACE5JM_13035, partial [Armatimonadota bacterium]
MIERWFPTFRHWLVRVAPRVGRGLLILFVLIAIPWTHFNIKFGRQIERRLAALKADGLPVTMADVVPEPVPDDQNAAVVYDEVFRVWHYWSKPTGRPREPTQSPLSEVIKPFTYDDRKVVLDAQARKMLRSPEARDVLDKLRYGSERPYFLFPVNWEDGFGALFPHLAECRDACRLIVAHASLLSEEGRVTEALDWLLVSLRMSEQARSDPTLVGQFVAYAMQAIAFDGMRDVLSQAAVSPPVAAEFEQLLRGIDLDEGFRAAMDAERAMVCDVYDLYRREPAEICSLLDIQRGFPTSIYFGWPGRPLHKLDQLIYLDYAKRFGELSEQPYRD